MSKYYNKKTVVDEIVFDSAREAERYRELRLMQNAGLISDLELQPKFLLQPPFRKNGKSYRAIYYVADFRYFDREKGCEIVEDVKGYKTEKYQLKKKMFEYRYSELSLVEVR